MGTLASSLAKQDIATPENRYVAHVEGQIEDVNGVLKITKIRVHYDIRVSPEKAEGTRRVFDAYLADCPAAQSVIGCIDIEHEIDIKEESLS